jgi:aryl-alcohol dehydrogenase-like predicted oxidoreductase
LRIDDPRYSRENRIKVADMLGELDPLCAELGLTTAQLMIGWTLAQPGITYALCGARTPRHAVDNARAGERLLSAEAVRTIDAVLDAYTPGLA